MSHSYSSDISREQFARILPCLESARRRTKPRTVDLYDVFCGVLYLLEKRVPVADAACGLPGLAHLLQVFPAMERATRPGEVFHSGAGLKKNRLAQPGEAMVGKNGPASVSWTPRASRTPTAPRTRAMTRARRCLESSATSPWTLRGCPMRFT